jgi:hypothetical protein
MYMILNFSLDWLGLARRDPVLGLHLSAQHLTLAAVRPDPVRLVAVGREIVYDVAAEDDDIRLVTHLAEVVRHLTTSLRLPAGLATVATIDPAGDVLDLRLGSGRSAGCPAPRRSYDRVVETVNRAGLQLVRVDPVPVSLARLARRVAGSPVAAARHDLWQVTTAEGRLQAERLGQAASPGLLVGPNLAGLQAVKAPSTIGVPRALDAVLDLGHDAPAIGAALAAAGIGPLVPVTPQTARVGAHLGSGRARQPTDAPPMPIRSGQQAG